MQLGDRHRAAERRNRETKYGDADDDKKGCEHLAQRFFRIYIAVAHHRHRDDRSPDPGGNVPEVACVEVSIFLTLDELDDVSCDDHVDDNQNDAKYDVSCEDLG